MKLSNSKVKRPQKLESKMSTIKGLSEGRKPRRTHTSRPHQYSHPRGASHNLKPNLVRNPRGHLQNTLNPAENQVARGRHDFLQLQFCQNSAICKTLQTKISRISVLSTCKLLQKRWRKADKLSAFPAQARQQRTFFFPQVLNQSPSTGFLSVDEHNGPISIGDFCIHCVIVTLCEASPKNGRNRRKAERKSTAEDCADLVLVFLSCFCGRWDYFHSVLRHFMTKFSHRKTW
eukprot:g11069.t1